jgi:hypothetical protein
MERINFIQYKGKSILIEDFSGMRPGQEFLDTLQKAQTLIAQQPPKSVLAVLDASNATFNTDILARMKNFVQSNTPHIKCATVVGVTGLLNVALTTLSKTSGREFHSFATRQEALDYLISLQ